MTIHERTIAVLAALAIFSVCAQSRADSATNPDLGQVSQSPPLTSANASPPAYCVPSNGVVTWNLPVYWDQPDSLTFPYSFLIQLATVGDPKSAPLGIVIPGGAGVPSIGTASGTIFPRSFNVIYTDVRGVGCNRNYPFATDALTTEYFARDVLSIVRLLGIRNYVLYGVSYGTVQATVMTNIAQNEGIQAPSALVLEGVLGNWRARAAEIVDYAKEWNRAKALLPPGVVSAFQTPSPYGIASSDWATLLTKTLNDGATQEHGGNTTVHYLRPLDDPTTRSAALVTIRGLIDQIKQSIPPETFWLASVLHCTETAGSIYKKDLVNGEIVNAGGNVCPQLGLNFVRPYDSVQYPVTVPIYYFEGSEDPDTSPANALYHYSNQTQANRVFTMIWGAGHPALSKTLHQTGCTPAIFTAIATNPAGVGAALTQCQQLWPLSFGGSFAGQ